MNVREWMSKRFMDKCMICRKKNPGNLMIQMADFKSKICLGCHQEILGMKQLRDQLDTQDEMITALLERIELLEGVRK